MRSCGSTSSAGSSSRRPVPSAGCSQPTNSAGPGRGRRRVGGVGHPAPHHREGRVVGAGDRQRGHHPVAVAPVVLAPGHVDACPRAPRCRPGRPAGRPGRPGTGRRGPSPRPAARAPPGSGRRPRRRAGSARRRTARSRARPRPRRQHERQQVHRPVARSEQFGHPAAYERRRIARPPDRWLGVHGRRSRTRRSRRTVPGAARPAARTTPTRRFFTPYDADPSLLHAVRRQRPAARPGPRRVQPASSPWLIRSIRCIGSTALIAVARRQDADPSLVHTTSADHA